MNLDFLAVDIRIILKTMYVVFLLGMIAATVFIWKWRRYIPKIVHDCLTGPDGLTYDPARVIGYPIIIVAAFIIICMNIYLGLIGKWDGNAFVTQIGGILLAHLGQSAAVLMKGNQEPKAGQAPVPGQTLQPIQPVTVPTTPAQQVMAQNQPLQPVQQPVPSVPVPPAR